MPVMPEAKAKSSTGQGRQCEQYGKIRGGGGMEMPR